MEHLPATYQVLRPSQVLSVQQHIEYDPVGGRPDDLLSLHITGGKVDAQRGEQRGPRSHSYQVVEIELEPKWLPS